mgnify:FL=1
MENNREFATFFSDAPKGKKIGAVLSWIATVILLIALFVPGFRVKFQTQDQNGMYRDIPATETYELNQAKEAWKLNVQLGTSKISGKLNSFLENGKTSVFSYLSDSSLLNAKLLTIEAITGAESGKSLPGWIFLIVFFVLIIVAAITGVYTMRWVTLTANLVGVLELLAVFFFVFKSRFNENGANLLTGSRVAPAMTAVLIALLVIAAILSVASVIVSYAVRSEEDAEGDAYCDDDDENRNAPTGLFNDETAPVTGGTFPASVAVAALIQMNTGKSFAITNNTELVIGKGSQADVIVANPIISRAHAKISCHNGTCTIQDLGSKNGTFVGDQKISGSDIVVLTDGMYITLGNEIFQFKV